ncbi:MAG: carbohydrate kinase [Clostridia bacterium]|nr:carbohydrate kinase [Clostridia bacterium]
MRVAAFGEIVWDVYPDKACLGGAPLNFAAHCVRHGGEAVMVSAVGDDDLGKAALEQMKVWQVDTAGVTVYTDKPTGRCLVTLDAAMVPTYHLEENTAWDAINGEGVACDVLYFGTLALRSAHNRRTLERLLNETNAEVFADVNLRAPFYDADTVAFALSKATTAKISDEELPTVLSLLGLPVTDDLDAVVNALFARFANLRTIVITCGSKGAFAATRDGETAWRDAVKTKVVSTVGAGDSFAAAFLCRYYQTGDLSAALEIAAKTAADVVASQEAVPAK